MKMRFTPNIDGRGRIVRAALATVLLGAGIFAIVHGFWFAGLPLLGAGLFVLFEAARGWCAVRACGIRTKL